MNSRERAAVPAGEPRRIPLRDRAGNIKAYAIVDAEDYDRVMAVGTWSLNSHGYARCGMRREGKQVMLRMHRVVMGLEAGDKREVDHVSRDRLDNRKVNLRIVTHAQNRQNTKGHDGGTSRHRGVSWDKERRKWKAQARLNYRNVIIGRFHDEEQAAAAVEAWRREHMPWAMD